MFAKRRLLTIPAFAAAIVISACASGVSSPASDVSQTSATLNGTVSSARDGTISYWFAYGGTTAYGSETPHRTMAISDRSAHPVSEPLSGLDPGTTYHFRVCAKFGGLQASCGQDQSFTTGQGDPTELSITTDPELYPEFNPNQIDYVTRCGTDPVSVDVAAPPGTEVAVDGQPARSGRFSEPVQLDDGQRFDFTTAVDAAPTTFHVRCLPSDFPTWTYSRTTQPSQQWTLLGISKGTPRFAAFFDRAGVPVWWLRPAGNPIDVKLLSDDTIAYARSSGGAFGTPDTAYEIRRLDGTLVNTLQTVGTPTDHHELLEQANGNFILVSYKPRDGVDLSAQGGPTDATVLDAEIQEVTPEGSLVWSWNSKDHIGLSETGGWWPFVISTPTTVDGKKIYDHVHLNAVDLDGDSLLISLRHTDAVYRISRADGHIEWKLGGTATPESLTVLNDPVSPAFGGQHDVRRLADGTVSIHDNGTRISRTPRVVRYRIDPDAKTATLVESLTDPEVTSSNCCGSARRLGSGGWLVGWGTLNSPTIAEYAADGSRVFKLFFSGAFSYRAFPVADGRVSGAELRHGMDTMAPR